MFTPLASKFCQHKIYDLIVILVSISCDSIIGFITARGVGTVGSWMKLLDIQTQCNKTGSKEITHAPCKNHSNDFL